MTAVDSEVTQEIAFLEPRGECLTGPDCEWLACSGLSEFIVSASRGRLLPSGRDTTPTDPWVLMLDHWESVDHSRPYNWIKREADIDLAVELFAKQDDVDAAIAAAQLMKSPQWAINRLLGLLPHTDIVYAGAKSIMRSSPDPRERLKLNAQIEAFRRHDNLKERTPFIEAVRGLITRAADTIVAHELQSTTQPTL